MLYPKISTSGEKLAPAGWHSWHVFATLSNVEAFSYPGSLGFYTIFCPIEKKPQWSNEVFFRRGVAATPRSRRCSAPSSITLSRNPSASLAGHRSARRGGRHTQSDVCSPSLVSLGHHHGRRSRHVDAPLRFPFGTFYVMLCYALSLVSLEWRSSCSGNRPQLCTSSAAATAYAPNESSIVISAKPQACDFGKK